MLIGEVIAMERPRRHGALPLALTAVLMLPVLSGCGVVEKLGGSAGGQVGRNVSKVGGAGAGAGAAGGGVVVCHRQGSCP